MSTDSVYLFLDILNVGSGPDHPKVIIEETFVKISHYFWFPAPRRTREQFRYILLWSKINVLPHSYLQAATITRFVKYIQTWLEHLTLSCLICYYRGWSSCQVISIGEQLPSSLISSIQKQFFTFPHNIHTDTYMYVYVDTLTESDAGFKVPQNTCYIFWRRLPDAPGV